jgi:hypothetical protein
MIQKKLKNLVLVAFATLSNALFTQAQTCHMPTSNPTQKYTTANETTCSSAPNYTPEDGLMDHTPKKTIKVNFHYFITDDPNNPRNLTETTGFSNSDTWNTGIHWANDLVTKLNNGLNSPLTVPPGNTLPNLDRRYKFVIYTDPNDASDKGIYFHKFSDWWDATSNTANTASDFWYKHWSAGGDWYPVHLKKTYSVHGENVVDIFFLDNTALNDYGGAAVSSLYGSAFGNSNTQAAMSCSDAYECWNNGGAWTESWVHHILHELGHTMDLKHTMDFDYCDDTWNTSGGCTYPNTNINSNNTMSYCNGQNTEAFSPCQLGRMHRYLERNHPKWIADESCRVNDADNITIKTGQNLVWSSTKHLNGSLIVESGATLTIKCDVFLKELGYIKVHPRGHLVIDGGTISSECDNKLFYGIFVLGDDTKNQSTSYQGLLELKNGATVEHAIIGIRTGDFYYDNNDLSWPSFCGKTGGIVQCVNANFKNNRKAIEFMSYHNIAQYPFLNEVDNASFFTGCNFANDAYLRGYEYEDVPLGFWGTEFVTAWDVQGVRFTNCDFKETYSSSFQPSLGLKTSAISSFGARYYVNNCHFNNLLTGVWAESNFDPMDYADIQNSTLDNVQRNITTLNQFGDKIAGNTITNQPASTTINSGNDQIVSWGIYTKGSTHFKIHDNNISSASPIGGIVNTGTSLEFDVANNNGIITSDALLGNSIVAENILTNQSVSMQTEDNNLDLQIACNQHSGNAISWLINPLSPAGFLNTQGGGKQCQQRIYGWL